MDTLEEFLENAPPQIKEYLADLCLTFAEKGDCGEFRAKIEILAIAVGVV